MRLSFLGTVVVCLFLLGPGCAHPQGSNRTDGGKTGTRFYFAQISDVHAGMGDHLDRLRSAVREINLYPRKLECVLVTGDLFSENIDQAGVLQETLDILKTLHAPVHATPGNHDGQRAGLQNSWLIFENHFGPLRRTVDHQGVLFVFPNIQTEEENSSLTEALGSLDWLEQTLNASKNQPAVVVNHIPSSEDYYVPEVQAGWPEPLNRPWTEILNRYKVKAVICGHFHRDEFHWVGKVPLYVCPAVAGHWGRKASYRIYTYQDGQLDYSTQYVDPWPRMRAGCAAVSASTEGSWNMAAAAVDDNPDTRWESRQQSDPEWLAVTFDEPRKIGTVFIDWETAAAKIYDLQTSPDGAQWTTAATITNGLPDEDRTIRFEPVETRHLRVYGRERATPWGYSIRELAVP